MGTISFSASGNATALERREAWPSGQLELIPRTKKEKPVRGAKAAKKKAPPKAPAPKLVAAKTAKIVRLTASDMAERQREISVSEFFTKNRHLLGFDSPAKALLTTVKEAVDNGLDACEEAGILPDLVIVISEISETRYRVVVQDNGPGNREGANSEGVRAAPVRLEVPPLRQSRGQQGSESQRRACTGSCPPAGRSRFASRTGPGKPGHEFEIQIDTKRNQPCGLGRELDGKAPAADKEKRSAERNLEHGTRVELEIEATYRRAATRWTATWSRPRWPTRKPKSRTCAGRRAPRIRARGPGVPNPPLESSPIRTVWSGHLVEDAPRSKARNIGSFLTAISRA